jgi:hypothetical protein
MKKLFILFLLITAGFSSFAQTNVYHPFPVSNAYWNEINYSMGSCEPPDYCKSTYFLKGDTIINSQLYHTLYFQYSGNGATYSGGLRENNKRIFYLNHNCSFEMIRYDFNLNIGDSILIPCFPCDSTSNSPYDYKKVIGIDSVLLTDMTYRKRMIFDNCAPWIEGIGCIGGLFFIDCSTCICWNETVCVQQDNTTIYLNDYHVPCFSLAVLVNNPTICIGDSAALTAINAQNYLWSTGDTTNSIIVYPLSNTTYTVTGTINGDTSIATAHVTIKPYLPVSVNIGAYTNTACEGVPVTFGAWGDNVGSNPIYQWYVNGVPQGTNNGNVTFPYLNNGDSISCRLTSSEQCPSGNPAFSDTIYMTIKPAPPVPVIVQSCDTFYSNAASGNQWYLVPYTMIAGATHQYYVPTDTIFHYVKVTGSNGCRSDSSNNLKPSLPVGVYVTVYPSPLCNEVPETFTAASINGGTSPIYQWYLNGTLVASNSNVYTDTFSLSANGKSIKCVLTSSQSCATGSPASSNIITLIVYPRPSPPTISQNGNMLFSSSIQGNTWYEAPDIMIPGGGAQMYLPSHNGYYFVTFTDSTGCASDSSQHFHFLFIDLIDYSGIEYLYIYPNPANEEIEIYVNQKSQIEILNLEGQLIKCIISEKNLSRIDISDFATGMYFVKVKNEKGVAVKKLIKE